MESSPIVYTQSPDSIISCFLMGGLGNQLFQIFTTISYGMNNKRNIIFPYTDMLTTGRHRPTYWNSFLSNLVIFTTRVNKQYIPYQFPRYNENGFHFTEIPKLNIHTVMLHGYFQSYLYFEDNKDLLFSMIELNNKQTDIRAEFDSLLTPSRDVSVRKISMHFRLGDYKLHPNNHPIMPFEYYKNALSAIISKHTTESVTQSNNYLYKVLYFCEKEDNDIVMSHIRNLSIDFPLVQFEKVDDDIPDWKQLLIMSCCNDNIIANSSFSWWGGYFNNEIDKTICYPVKWFGPAINHDVRDLFPPYWTKIIW